MTTTSKTRWLQVIVVSVVPSLIVSLLFYTLLGHRRDYLGHYAAGYGGTLCALAVVLAALPTDRYVKFAVLTIVPVTVACMAAGAVAEATVFRLAKFDEIDFFNQSIGAVLAGLVAMHFVTSDKPTDAVTSCIILVGVVFLLAGGYFAVT